MIKDLKTIPLIFSVDDNYAPFLGVALKSIFDNCDKNYDYKVYVLNTNLSSENKNKLCDICKTYATLEFVDVKEKIKELNKELHVRDYYTDAIYFRLFIPSIFKEYDKALYLDCDIIAIDDVSKLYNTQLNGEYLAAITEEVMTIEKVFGEYSEKGLDIPRENYFNSGIILLNLKELRRINLDEVFSNLLNKFKFEVAPDQDYLNVICKDKTKYVDLGWNKAALENPTFDDKDLKIIHYKLANKPWHYDDILYGEYFWEYAKKTPYYLDILKMKNNYTVEDMKRDALGYENLKNLAKNYLLNVNNYKRSKES